MIDSLATAHSSGYLHGLIAGGAFGGLAGIVLGMIVVVLLNAAAGEPPAPTSRISLLPTRADFLDNAMETVQKPARPVIAATEDHPAIEREGGRLVSRRPPGTRPRRPA